MIKALENPFEQRDPSSSAGSSVRDTSSSPDAAHPGHPLVDTQKDSPKSSSGDDLPPTLSPQEPIIQNDVNRPERILSPAVPLKKKLKKRYEEEKRIENATIEMRKAVEALREEIFNELEEKSKKELKQKMEYDIQRLIALEVRQQEKARKDQEELTQYEREHAATLLKKKIRKLGERELLALERKNVETLGRMSIGGERKEKNGNLLRMALTSSKKLPLPELIPFDTQDFESPSARRKRLQDEKEAREEAKKRKKIEEDIRENEKNASLFERAKRAIRRRRKANDLPTLQMMPYSGEAIEVESPVDDEEGPPRIDYEEKVTLRQHRIKLREEKKEEETQRRLHPEAFVYMKPKVFEPLHEELFSTQLYFLSVEKRRMSTKIEQEDWFKALSRALGFGQERVETIDQPKNKGGRPLKKHRGRNAKQNNARREKANETRKEAIQIKRRQLRTLCEIMDKADLLDVDVEAISEPADSTMLTIDGLELTYEQARGVGECIGNLITYFDSLESDRSVDLYIPKNNHKSKQHNFKRC